MEALADPNCGWFYRRDADTFKQIPGSPIAYWVSEAMLSAFGRNSELGNIATARDGIHTCNNNSFLRLWWEVDLAKSSLPPINPVDTNSTWFAYNKGGNYRKWCGNNEYVIDWKNNGERLRSAPNAHGFNGEYAFQSAISWSSISSGKPAFRFKPNGYMFDAAGYSMFAEPNCMKLICGFSNSSVAEAMLSFLSPMLNYQAGDIISMPLLKPKNDLANSIDWLVGKTCAQSQLDWDSFENSWSFSRHPLI